MCVLYFFSDQGFVLVFMVSADYVCTLVSLWSALCISFSGQCWLCVYFCFSQNKLWQRRLNLLRHQRAQHLHFLTNLQNCKTSKCQQSSDTCLIAILCSKQLQNFIIHNIGRNKAHLLWSVLVPQFLGQLALLESTDIGEQVLFWQWCWWGR